MVWWLSVGSIPGVLIGTGIFASVLDTEAAEDTIRVWLGGALVMALGAGRDRQVASTAGVD